MLEKGVENVKRMSNHSTTSRADETPAPPEKMGDEIGWWTAEDDAITDRILDRIHREDMAQAQQAERRSDQEHR